MRTLIIVVAAALAAPLAFAAQPEHLQTIGRADLPPKVEAAIEQQAGADGVGPITRIVDSRNQTRYQTTLRDSGRVVTFRPDGSNVANARR